jgi:hypothetical protein
MVSLLNGDYRRRRMIRFLLMALFLASSIAITLDFVGMPVNLAAVSGMVTATGIMLYALYSRGLKLRGPDELGGSTPW